MHVWRLATAAHLPQSALKIFLLQFCGCNNANTTACCVGALGGFTRVGRRFKNCLGSGSRHKRLAASTTSKGPTSAGMLHASPCVQYRERIQHIN
eukprot:scaffold487318_cov47-Prasinocladus_malaysianus.AAC.1